ncbi:MAG: hypothetical protein R2706_07440 [Acidimicrobiales bacterium]
MTVAPSGRFLVEVQSPDDGEAEVLPTEFDLVLNCSGSTGLRRPNPSPLLENLLDSGLCVPTQSGSGLALDDTIAAAPNVFVVGPLMADNVIDGTPIWHVEHAGRILPSAARSPLSSTSSCVRLGC